jgi:hypothetical protein
VDRKREENDRLKSGRIKKLVLDRDRKRQRQKETETERDRKKEGGE